MQYEIDHYPLISAALPEKRTHGWADRRDLANGLALLNEANAAGGLIKTRHKDLRDYVNRCFHDAWHVHCDEAFILNGLSKERSQQEIELDRRLSYYPECHTAKSFLKRVESSKLDTPFTRALVALLREMISLADPVNALKDKIIVKPVKTDEEKRPIYTPPLASQKALKAVSDVLIQITSNNFEHLKQELRARYENTINKFLDAALKSRADGKSLSFENFATYEGLDGRRRVNVMVEMLLSDTVDEDVIARLDTAEAYLTKRVQREAEDTRARFLIKNMGKLSSIVEAKGDFDRVVLVENTLQDNFLKGTLDLFFKDGARFRAKNNIVWSFSILDKEFARFPLTFQSVYFAGKVKMSNPSEKRMNEIFVKGKL